MGVEQHPADMSQLARLRAHGSKYVVSMSLNRRSCVFEAVFPLLRRQVLGNSIVNEAGSMNEMITGENSPCTIHSYALRKLPRARKRSCFHSGN
jgi:hypothetical protein